jgi:hypothetical protein
MYSYVHGQIISESQSYQVDSDGIDLEGSVSVSVPRSGTRISLRLQLMTQRLLAILPSLTVLSALAQGWGGRTFPLMAYPYVELTTDIF